MAVVTAGAESNARHHLFAECRARDLVALRHLYTEVAVAPGRVLLREREPGRQFFVVTAGRARVDIESKPVGFVDAGSFVGELSLLDDVPCVATVTAVTPMHLLVFGRSEFRMLLELPGVSRQMLRTIGQRLRSVDVRLAS